MKPRNTILRTVSAVAVVMLFAVIVAFGRPKQQPLPNPLRQQQAQKDGAPKQPNAPNEAQINRLIISRLDLSQDQRQRIRQIQRENQPLIKNANLNVQEKRRALDDALYNDNYDDSLVTQRVSDLVEAQAAAVRARFKQEASIRQVLTPDQVREFRKMRDVANSVQGMRQNQKKADGRVEDPGQF